ncbi:MAG TPA: divalent-cation tolerance protein CutA [Actinomycetota bacterium]|nr:divalent-cation tolerance protein CutA [Actinomycetota bacterium]
MSEPEALQVFCTIDSELRARELASALVEASVAACVQVVGPIHSTYRWEGTVETATEWLLLMKTTEARLPTLRDAIVEAHPYEVPEVVAVPITAGLRPYLDWIAAST